MKLNNKFALLLAGAMLAGALTGCGASGTPASSAASSEAAASSAVSEAASEPAAEAALPDGTYAADFDTDSSMFHANEAFDGRGALTVKEGRMTLTSALSPRTSSTSTSARQRTRPPTRPTGSSPPPMW